MLGIVNYNNDLCAFIYLSVCNALPMIPLSQVKVSYIPRFYRSLLKHLFSYYNTIFKLILFKYDTSLSNKFVVLLISVVNVDLFLNCRHL